MTPLGQARAHRAWRGLPLAPIYSSQDLFYVAMWEQERIRDIFDAKLFIELLLPLSNDPERIQRIQRALYSASQGRYTAPEERLDELKSREQRLKEQLQELREQIALAQS